MSLSSQGDSYTNRVPKLWSKTIEDHKRVVHDTILDTTAAMVDEHGLLSVTMAQIAERSGIGRATLYKYFPDVEAILHSWHERQITNHLEQLAASRDRPGSPMERLEAVLDSFAFISHNSQGHRDTELAALLHGHEQVAPAEHRVRQMIQGLLVAAAKSGAVRDDMPPEELAGYCLHALTAARNMPTKAAVRRLVAVTLAGLRPPA